MIVFKNVVALAGGSLMILGCLPLAHGQTNPANLPRDVTQLVDRQSSCLEWSQKAFDPERKTQLNDIISTLRSLKCGEIEDDAKSLRQKYAGDPEILEALKARWAKVVKRVPVRDAVPLPDLEQPR